MDGIWGENELGSQAVYLVEESRLVVFGERADQLAIKALLERDMVWRLKTEITVFSVDEVKAEPLYPNLTELPEGGNQVAKLSFLHLPEQGCQAITNEGGFEVEVESYIDSELGLFENRAICKMEHDGVKFSWNTGFYVINGKPKIFEVGSLDGKKTVLVSFQQDLVMFDGSPYDDWILKEEQGAFLADNRSARLRNFAEGERPLGGERLENGLLAILVPPTFLSFISNENGSGEHVDDPFAPTPGKSRDELAADLREASGIYLDLKRFQKHDLLDVSDLMKAFGVSMREGDFVVYHALASKIYVKVSPENEALIDRICKPGEPEYPRLIQLNLVQFSKGGGDGEEKVIEEKIVVCTRPGPSAECVLGGRLKLEAEAYVNAGEGFVEARFRLSKKMGGELKQILDSGSVLLLGEPLVIHESEVDGVAREWV